MFRSAEAELGALYINAWEAIPMQLLLEEMGHKQTPTPIQTDNSTAHRVVGNNIQPRCTKAMGMIFHWLNCQDAQGQFQYYWCPGPKNQANYWTKHHCTAHHIEKHPTILTSKFILDALQASTQRTPATTGKGLMKFAPTAAGAP
jgi:hypothetical protein